MFERAAKTTGSHGGDGYVVGLATVADTLSGWWHCEGTDRCHTWRGWGVLTG